MRKNFGAKPMCYPMPVYIIGTYNADGTPNAMNAAWGTIADFHQVAIYLAKEHKIQKAMLDIKDKYGKNAILKGMNLQEGATTIERNQQIGGHKA